MVHCLQTPSQVVGSCLLLHHHDMFCCFDLHLGPKRIISRSELKYSRSHLRFPDIIDSQQCLQFLRSLSQLTLPHPGEINRSRLHQMFRLVNCNDFFPNHQRLPSKRVQNNVAFHCLGSYNCGFVLPPALNPR